MQNRSKSLNGFKRHLLDIAKGLILHYFRDPHFGVSGGANQPSAGFVVSGHVNLCHFCCHLLEWGPRTPQNGSW